MKTRSQFGAPEPVQEDAQGGRNGGYVPAMQEMVRGELEKMLSSPLFAQSNRCKGFLSYVVKEALAGHSDQLKERTIGVNVFDRAHDYDTGDDSIVRVTANDVRKRIGQYYQEVSAGHRVLIDLPRGSYIPEFHLVQKKRARAEERKVADESQLPEVDEADAMPAVIAEEAATNQRVAEVEAAPAGKIPWKRKMPLIAAVLLVAACLTAAGIWRNRMDHSAPQIWETFSHSTAPVLICLGEHDIDDSDARNGSNKITVADVSIHKQMIPVDDATVVAALASRLGKLGIPFRLVGAEQISFTDFQRQPVILIGAMDNKWAIRLSQGLPYRIDVSRPSGPGGEPVTSIVEANKADSQWAVDFATPLAAWKKDYAIVARMDDATSGVPVLMEAGLGNAGSVAASEMLISGELTGILKNEPQCASKASFEAVIGTEIIEGKPGPPHLLRLDCW